MSKDMMSRARIYLILPNKYPRPGGHEAAGSKIEGSDVAIDVSRLSDVEIVSVIEVLGDHGATVLNSPFSGDGEN
jgi:hypothetical protein